MDCKKKCMKVCTKCGIEKDESEYYKHKRNGKYSFDTYCKVCYGLLTKEWAKNNREKRNEIARRWHKNNPEKTKESKKRAIAKMKANGTENKVKRNARLERYRKKNPDKFKKWWLIGYVRNHDKILERSKAYADKNREKIKQRTANHINSLTDSYVKTKLKRQGFTDVQLNPDIIEAKRILIKIHRYVKEKTHH